MHADSPPLRHLHPTVARKYRGIFAQVEYYNRWVRNFDADAPLPVDEIHDQGFYVQAAFYPIKKKLEVYGVPTVSVATSFYF